MKRLIVCCDGTWQKLSSPYPTNVVRIAQGVKPTDSEGVHQLVFYDEGVGTGSGPDRLLGGAFGWGLDQNILDGYRFLSFNYTPGDEVYLFGFSRGAYTVRSLAGLIHCSGLVERSHIRQVPEAYELYRDRHLHPTSPQAVEFRQQYGHHVTPDYNIPLKFLGCWDTVGALGVPDQIPYLPIDKWINEKYRFHNTQLSHLIEKACHAVAIDEIREPFDVTVMKPNPDYSQQTLKQIWFPGDHGSLGGGTKATRGLADAALQWMMQECSQLGLEFNPTAITSGIQTNPLTPFDNSPQGIFKLTRRNRRNIQKHSSFADLHQSVIERWHHLPAYRPENLEPFREQLEKQKI
ncbi:DUF2235 domain-containing protein [Spirulina sp. CS-785/01]|uniref:DUF2235 domain-containing protein n=1 Tax=Spirulina sp. CS-785/01 TaxID=3021716 RepID=UPI00232C9DBB|nr:DUF2235 domain-containing protein [Spirulina sp. CS-785/01]MDB9311695.1 DUF2235 domain-containing protein [Spirulina sp. CS-785/01]